MRLSKGRGFWVQMEGIQKMKCRYLLALAAVLFCAGCSSSMWATRVNPWIESVVITHSPEQLTNATFIGTARILFDSSMENAEKKAKDFTYGLGGNIALIRIENWWGVYPIYAVDAYRL